MLDRAAPAAEQNDPRWSQFPQPVHARARGTVVLAVLTSAAPVAGAAAGGGVSAGWCWSAAALAGLAGWWWSRRRRYDLVTLAPAAALAVLVGLLAGRPAAWSLLLSLLALAAARGLTASQRVRGAAPMEPVTGLALLAGWWGWRSGAPLTTLSVQAASVLVAVIGHLPGQPLDKLARWLHRAVHAAVVLVSRVLFGLLGVVFVLVPWALARCVAWDPTWSRHPSGSRLVPLDRTPLEVDRQWRTRPDLLPVGARRRLHALALVVPVLVLALVIAGVAWSRYTPPPDGAGSAALADASWWADARPEQLSTFDDATIDGFEGPVLADVRSEHTNVVDGRRRSWSPEDPELTVWFFGGSAAFGLGQRDDHTIASQLARTADADGVPIEVVNFGVHGDVHWMELNRLRAELARGAAPPDLVVFYDGFNELATFDHLRNTGRWRGEPFVGSEHSTGIQRVPGGLARWVPGSWSSGSQAATGEDAAAGDAEVVAAATAQYQESVAVTRAVLDELDVPGLFVYQPSRVTRSEPLTAEGADDAAARRREREFRSALPAGVVDLSAALDSTEQPVYWDAVHTNELGAGVVAEALWQQLGPRLEAMAEEDR